MKTPLTVPAGKPLVSIIIPMYNSVKYIATSIESALNQTWPNKEIIVVDDGSTDNSLEIARAFETKGTVKVIAQQNSGSAAARNKGGKCSNGDYIQYLDADDLLAPDKIELQLNLLNEVSEGLVSSCSWGMFDEQPADAVFLKQQVWKDMLPVEWLTTAWSGGGMMQTACWLTPRSLIEEAGPWNESFKQNPNDDGEFFCRVLLKSKGVRYCEEAKVFYRTHPGERVSTKNSRQAVQSLLSTCLSYEQHIKHHEVSPRVIHALVENYASFMYRYYNTYPDLAAIAEQQIRLLGVKKIPSTGGRYFKKGAALIGFKTMLKLRSVFKNY